LTLEPPVTLAQIQADPTLATTVVQHPALGAVTVRPVTHRDAPILGAYFTGLGEETRRRYGPHPFDQATADTICAEIAQSNAIRFIAVTGDDSEEQVVAYFILVVGVLTSDVRRYQEIGLPLDPETDCTLAPSVADAYQSRGLGSLVFTHVRQVARQLGKKRIVLWGGVQATNERGKRFYAKNGFRYVNSFEHPPGTDNDNMILDLA
jgi:GNAT superfamily N-acetyltransferase